LPIIVQCGALLITGIDILCPNRVHYISALAYKEAYPHAITIVPRALSDRGVLKFEPDIVIHKDSVSGKCNGVSAEFDNEVDHTCLRADFH